MPRQLNLSSSAGIRWRRSSRLDADASEVAGPAETRCGASALRLISEEAPERVSVVGGRARDAARLRNCSRIARAWTRLPCRSDRTSPRTSWGEERAASRSINNAPCTAIRQGGRHRPNGRTSRTRRSRVLGHHFFDTRTSHDIPVDARGTVHVLRRGDEPAAASARIPTSTCSTDGERGRLAVKTLIQDCDDTFTTNSNCALQPSVRVSAGVPSSGWHASMSSPTSSCEMRFRGCQRISLGGERLARSSTHRQEDHAAQEILGPNATSSAHGIKIRLLR